MAGAQLSPDGRQVVFSVTESTAEGAASHLWLVGVGAGADGSPARQLTYSPAADKRGESSAAWSPDSRAIFFLAHRGETTQLFRLPLAGGEAMPYDLKVTPLVDDSKAPGALPPSKSEAETKPAETKPADPLAINVGGYAVSPDGRWLAVWARDPETPGEKKDKTAKADAVWVDHETHRTRLYLAAMKPDGALDGGLKLTGVEADIHSAIWSPASDRLLALTEPPNDAGDLKPAAKAWLLATSAPDKPVALASVPATVRGGAAWSADGNQIAFAAQTPEDAPPGVEELYALALPTPAAMAGKASDPTAPRRLMAGFDGGLGYGQPVFLADGKVLAPVAQGTRLGAVELSLDGSATPLASKTPIMTGLATNPKQTGWLWVVEGSDHPPTLCYAARLGGDCVALGTPALSPKPLETVKTELIHWQNSGLTIEGLLSLPPEATSSHKVPLIVEVHGGPLGAWEDRYDPWAGFLLGHGWAILRPNPRGSSGYGAKFAAANHNDLGGEDFQDIMAGADAVVKSYPVDPDKMAMMGYSYGGEMAGFAEGKTDRFKAIVSGAPVIDQFSEYGTERGSWYDRWYYGLPWEHFADAWRQSPLSGASHARTPFLLIQGQADVTDPLGQSEEMYRALRQIGAPVELVTYPREDHGPLARGIFGYPSPEPWHGFDGRQRIVDFLDKNLNAGTGAKP